MIQKNGGKGQLHIDVENQLDIDENDIYVRVDTSNNNNHMQFNQDNSTIIEMTNNLNRQLGENLTPVDKNKPPKVFISKLDGPECKNSFNQ